MGDISGRRRGHGEDAIYFDADKNRSPGLGQRGELADVALGEAGQRSFQD